MKRHHWRKEDDGEWCCRVCTAIAANYYETDYRRHEDCDGFRKLSTESSTLERSGTDNGTQDSPGKGSAEKATGGTPGPSDSPGGTGTGGAKGDSVKEKHLWVKVEVKEGKYEYHCVGCGFECVGTSECSAMDMLPCLGRPSEDKVNHPSHYTAGSIECIDAIEAAVGQMQGLDAFYTAQVLKYLWRWPLKGGVEDLKKARWYLERLIAKKESKP